MKIFGQRLEAQGGFALIKLISMRRWGRREVLINRKRCSCQHVAGYPPFYDDNPFGIYEKILSGKLEWPRHVEMTAKDLVKRLLVQDRTKRLGCMKAGAEDIKRHRFSSLSSSIRSSSSSLSSLRTTRSTGGLVKIQGLFKKQLIEIEWSFKCHFVSSTIHNSRAMVIISTVIGTVASPSSSLVASSPTSSSLHMFKICSWLRSSDRLLTVHLDSSVLSSLSSIILNCHQLSSIVITVLIVIIHLLYKFHLFCHLSEFNIWFKESTQIMDDLNITIIV